MDELSDAHKFQVKAYVAEYQAMMTRVNWFMSMQFMPAAPLVVFYSVIAATYRYFGPILAAWGVAWMTQIAILIYYFALHEVYNHVLYIETKLKPKVAVLLQLDKDSFWGWEKHLKQFGKAHNPLFGDRMPAVISGVALIVAAASIAVRRTPASGWDCLGTVVAGTLLLAAVTLARRVVKVREELEAALHNTAFERDSPEAGCPSI